MSSLDHGVTIITKNPRVEFSVRNGIRWEQDFLCQSGSVSAAKYQDLINKGYDPVRYSPPDNGGYILITACSAYDQASGPNGTPLPTWQIDSYGDVTDLFDAKYNPIAKKLHPSHLAKLVEARNDPPSEGQFPAFNTTLRTLTSNPQEQLYFAHLLWKSYQHGEKGAPHALPILRRSYNISDFYTITDTLQDVDDTIISTGTLIASEHVPNAYASIIARNGSETVTDGSLKFKWGWIKRYPTVHNIGDNQSQVSQEWVYGFWNYSTTYLKSI